MSNGTTGGITPISERTIPVHKRDAEGALLINAFTGVIQQPHDERPEWADGLACGLMNERHEFYTQRLGQQYADEHRHPEALAFEDLSWIGVDAETGAEMELPADDEFRMEAIAEFVGIDREEGTFTKATLAEVELSLDRVRTEGEVGIFEETQAQGFEKVDRTGTGG